MKTLIALLGLLFTAFAFSEPADAPAKPTIGCTEAEARAKYGRAVKEFAEAPSDKGLTFQKGDIRILAYLKDGRVWKLEYVTRGATFTRASAEVLLANNGGPWEGHYDPRTGQIWWKCGTMFAILYDDTSLGIKTAEFIEAEGRASAAALKGL